MNNTLRFRGFAIGVGGRIVQPFNELIEVQAATAVPWAGGHGSAQSAKFSYRDILKFDLAQSEVTGLSGDDDEETPRSINVKSKVEGLNILDMVTADRVVANLVATFPSAMNSEPSFRFLGTRFENLKIAGTGIEVDIAMASAAEAPSVRLVVPERAGLRLDNNNAVEAAGFGTITLATFVPSGAPGGLCMIQVDLRGHHKGKINLCCIDGGIDGGGE